MYVFLAFLLVPLIEIALFIQVGAAIGLWPTLGIVVLTAVLGTWLVRSQGQAALMRLRQSFSALDDPTEPLAHGAMILFAGALLLTPGFFTDAVGFALLIPSVRVFVMRYLSARVSMQSFHMGSAQGHGFSGGTVIDGEFEEVRPEKVPRSPPSGWVEGPERH